MSDELKARLAETRAAKAVNCVLGCGFESRFTPEYRHAEGCEAYDPDDLRAELARERERAEKAERSADSANNNCWEMYQQSKIAHDQRDAAHTWSRAWKRAAKAYGEMQDRKHDRLVEAQIERDAARAEADALKQELERWRHARTVEGDLVCPDTLERDALRARAERYREALTKHGQHGKGCQALYWWLWRGGPGPKDACDCGLARALEEPPAPESAKATQPEEKTT